MSAFIKNTRTGAEIPRPEPIDEEVLFDGGVMITETDRYGIITYANKKFREMTGYSKEELIGAPHSINRHPDMPKAAFREMWRTIRRGRYWEGYVKNLRKDGRFYQVIVWIKPRLDDRGNIIGYIAGRKVPNPLELQKAMEEYRALKTLEERQGE